MKKLPFLKAAFILGSGSKVSAFEEHCSDFEEAATASEQDVSQ